MLYMLPVLCIIRIFFNNATSSTYTFPLILMFHFFEMGFQKFVAKPYYVRKEKQKSLENKEKSATQVETKILSFRCSAFLA